MPDPRGNGHIDIPMTNMSVMYIQQATNYIATQVFPIIPVTRQSDLYFIYNQGDFLRDEARIRGPLSESAGGDYRLSTDTYYARKYAFHRDVSEEERLNANVPLNTDLDTTLFVTEKMLLNREIAWADRYFKTGVWDNEITGVTTTPTANQTLQWSLPTSDPIGDITKATVLMASKTGYRPNTLVLTPDAYAALKNHPDILDRIKYTQRGVVTTDILATLFDVERIYVFWAVANQVTTNEADDIKFIMPDGSALLAYVARSPGLRTVSAGYTYTWNGLRGANGIYGNRIVRIPIPLNGLGSERIEAEIAYDMKVVGSSLGVYFNTIAAAVNP